jgi:tRNA A37 threonylcarbamoyladenosine dehydratase
MLENNGESSPFTRTAWLLGEENMRKLYAARVAVFGLGGVGGHCAEALVRSGVGSINLFDHDKVDITNINRQIVATTATVGLYKADVMRERLLAINPKLDVTAYKLFYLPEIADTVDLAGYDYIVDAMDTLAAKLELACRAGRINVPLISAMGAANKMEANAFLVADIYETSVCPLARLMRCELRKRGVKALKVVYSKEMPRTPIVPGSGAGRQKPASNAFVPPAMGLILAGEVVKGICEKQ